jgi:hypothetical protein
MHIFLRLVIGTLQEGELLPFREVELELVGGEFPDLGESLGRDGWEAILYLVVKLDVEHQYMVGEFVWDEELEVWRVK